MTALTQQGRRRRRLAAAAAFSSVVLNGGLIVWLGLSAPDTLRPIPQSRVLDLTLPMLRSMKAVQDSAKAASVPRSAVSTIVVNRPAERPPPTAAPSTGVQAPGLAKDGPGLVDDGPPVAQNLRASVGCQHADFLGLSTEERADCAQRFAAGRAVESGAGPLSGIAPAKLARFDAEWKADHSPQHMAGIGCVITFGVGKPKAVKLIRALKLGALPCYIVSPTAAVAPDN